MIADNIAKKSASMAAEESAEKKISVTRRDLLPPFNDSAASVEEVYPTDKLITPEEWKSLNDAVAIAADLMKSEVNRTKERSKPHGYTIHLFMRVCL